MTTHQRRIFEEGREMFQVWRQTKQNAGLYPTNEDIRKLARSLDLSVSYVQERITAFLD